MFGGMQRIYSFLQVCRSCYTDLQCIISTLSSPNIKHIILLFIAFLLYSLRIFLHMSPMNRVQFIPVTSFLQCFYNIFSMSVSSAEKYYEATFHFIIMFSQNKMQLLSFPVSRKIQKRFRPSCVSLLSEHFCVLVPQIDPSVPQPVVQLRRRPLLGPSPGWKRLLALSHLRHY